MNDHLPTSHATNVSDVTLPERAERIRSLVNVARGCIIEVGRELIAAHDHPDLVQHGGWVQWLRNEFDWSVATAYNYIAIARRFPSLGNLSDIVITGEALTLLASENVPQEARDEVVERTQAGEHITKAEADRIVADAVKAEVAKAIEAERGADLPQVPSMTQLGGIAAVQAGAPKHEPAPPECA